MMDKEEGQGPAFRPGAPKRAQATEHFWISWFPMDCLDTDEDEYHDGNSGSNALHLSFKQY